ncbi:translation initiation factor IF-2 subunit gamma [Candidatus Micrarchaeota archaeon]|nr:translation initiation factor IF-2 subunit gamma [Candidatus Micrarchaeota archaeon]MBU1166722.1 translation initiation factor IF-2 subunit gamma [Candidatus Micrarchaeota archaeon]MBU1886639.1 translation initiation factor IF-2 subunit gamma [Candidatus Micrarchaeota archaeon]
MQADMNIGMLGHVDHGKTTLTSTLTGKWTDTHSEEVKRGISIRLGYADAYIYHCEKCDLYSSKEECGKCGGKVKLVRKISIVDAPGHETLMTTVISATSILDGVMFLIAANEPCPQPQTLEHLLVLNSTGIKNIIVVQTKVDLVTKEKAIENYHQIKKFLKGSAAENAPIIPVSANNNVNIHVLLQEIIDTMKAPKYDEKAQLRMYVSRSFDVNRPGTDLNDLVGGVLGGSIVQGVLSVGDKVELRPGIVRKEGAKYIPVLFTVKSLMEEKDKLEIAKSGGLVAMETLLDPSLAKSDALVGSVVGKPGEVPEPIDVIKVKYELLERADVKSMPLRENEPVVINVHTSTGVGLLVKLSKGVATINLKRSTVIYPDMHVAISRRMGQRWRLSAWGKIV